MKIHLSIILLSSLIISTGYAELIVVRDLGNTVDAKPYLDNIKGLKANSNLTNNDRYKRNLQVSRSLYPVISNFSPGKVIDHRIASDMQYSFPFFIVGDDKKSQEWLRVNGSYLKGIHAIGMLTNASSNNTIINLAKKQGVNLMPTQINGMQNILGGNHYPVLAYDGRVKQ